jgi:hypothetical protein
MIGAQEPGCDAPTEVLVTLFTAESTQQGVRIRWRVGGDEPPVSAWIERSDTEQGPFQRIESERVLEGGATVDWDHSTQPGRSYWYRLVWTTSSGQQNHSSPIEALSAPSPSVFALRAIVPNPTTGPVTIEYALPRSAEIELTVHDVLGREVARLAMAVQTSGLHVTHWMGETHGGRAKPGVYFLRLRHPEGQTSRRILLRR